MDKGEGGGLVIADILRTWGEGGVNFLQFCADVFYEQPLKGMLIEQTFELRGPWAPLNVNVLLKLVVSMAKQ